MRDMARVDDLWDSLVQKLRPERFTAMRQDGRRPRLTFQSNHEGGLIDRLERLDYDAVVCNFGALSHTSYPLHHALLTADRRAVDVHISDITTRQPWRSVSATAPGTPHQVIGHGSRGDLEAIDWLLDGAGTG